MSKEFYCNVRQWGNNLLYIGYDDKGQRVQEKIEFSPTLYVADQTSSSQFKSFDGVQLAAVQQPSIKDAKQFIKTYDECASFKIYGTNKFNSEYIAKKFRGDVPYDSSTINVQIIDIEVNSENGFPDPYQADEEITAITIKNIKNNTFYVWTIKNKYGGDFDENNLEYISEEFKNQKIVHFQFENDRHLMKHFINHFSSDYPDVLTGWYSRDFDIPYIYNRLKKLFGDTTAKRLSPWGYVNEKIKKQNRFGIEQEKKVYDIYGIAEIDYMDLYQKYTYSASESYALEFICQKHLGVGKLSYDGSITDLLKGDYQKYVEYNIIDVERIHNLDDKLKFIELLLEVSYAGKVCAYTDSLGTVRYWENLIYNHLYEKNQFSQICSFVANDDTSQIEGAFVKSPIAGRHQWVVSFDLASLYPSIIRQVNIGPETRVDYNQLPDDLFNVVQEARQQRLIDKTIDLSVLKKYDVSLSGNKQIYRKSQKSFLSELMGKFFNLRKEYKKEMLAAARVGNSAKEQLFNTKQLAIKILINSAYGAVGNSFFQFYSRENAEAITTTGKVVIQWIEKRLNAYLNKLLNTPSDTDRIIAIDTDSVYIDMSEVVEKIMPGETNKIKITKTLDKICQEKIERFINSCYAELFDYMNHHENHMAMDREIISDVAVWTGKKRYFMNVYDKEGKKYYNEDTGEEFPDTKIMGIEVVRSSTPAPCRDALKEALKIILRQDEKSLIQFVSKTKENFKTLPAEEIGSPSSANNIEKYQDPSDKNKYVKGTPIHIRGCITFNKLMKDHGLDKQYDMIKSGEKIKYVYLHEPNPIRENVISFNQLHDSFDLNKYVDYNTQLEKTMLQPLKRIADTIGWKIEEGSSLMSLFE